MSLARCDYCSNIVDTDADPDSCEYIGEVLCSYCRDDKDERERCLQAFEADGGGCICGHHELVRRQPDVGIFHDYLE